MTDYYLRSWSKRDRIFLRSNGRVVPVPNDNFSKVTDGFIKRFFLGGRVIVYKGENGWELSIDGDVYLVSQIKEVELKRVFIFDFITIRLDHKSYNLRDFSILEYFSRKLDPTHDYMDDEHMFGFWLKELIKKENGSKVKDDRTN